MVTRRASNAASLGDVTSAASMSTSASRKRPMAARASALLACSSAAPGPSHVKPRLTSCSFSRPSPKAASDSAYLPRLNSAAPSARARAACVSCATERRDEASQSTGKQTRHTGRQTCSRMVASERLRGPNACQVGMPSHAMCSISAHLLGFSAAALSAAASASSKPSAVEAMVPSRERARSKRGSSAAAARQRSHASRRRPSDASAAAALVRNDALPGSASIARSYLSIG